MGQPRRVFRSRLVSSLLKGPDRTGVLFVCTGNICRSPLAAQLAAARGLFGPGRSIDSRGLEAAVGVPMDPRAAACSRILGGDPSAARGRQLEASDLTRAALVLAMTRSQRDDLVRRFPAVLRRTFTLAEFTHLIEVLGPLEGRDEVSLVDEVERCSRHRGAVSLQPSHDVVDPIGQPVEVHQRTARDISEYLSRIARRVPRWA